MSFSCVESSLYINTFLFCKLFGSSLSAFSERNLIDIQSSHGLRDYLLAVVQVVCNNLDFLVILVLMRIKVFKTLSIGHQLYFKFIHFFLSQFHCSEFHIFLSKLLFGRLFPLTGICSPLVVLIVVSLNRLEVLSTCYWCIRLILECSSVGFTIINSGELTSSWGSEFRIDLFDFLSFLFVALGSYLYRRSYLGIFLDDEVTTVIDQKLFGVLEVRKKV